MPKIGISPRQVFTGRNRARRHYRAKWIAGARRASQGTLVVDPNALLLSLQPRQDADDRRIRRHTAPRRVVGRFLGTSKEEIGKMLTARR